MQSMENKPGNTIDIRFKLKRKDFELDVDFQTPDTGVIGVFGSSGSGKTSLLRCLAGLEEPALGYLKIHQHIWHDDNYHMPTHRRPIAYVFQEANLFPHLNIHNNLEYGWKRIDKNKRSLKFDDVVAWLGLESFLDRSPDQLSGGQRQRAAMGRALLTSPELLLMDEPLANLDPPSKSEILPYLENLYKELDIPVFYVSHSPSEIQQLADHLILMDQGKIQANGEINELLTNTALPIAHLEDAAAVINAQVVSHDKKFHLTQLAFDGGKISVSYNGLPVGHKARLRICARDVSLAVVPPEQTSISNIFPVKILETSPDRDPSQLLITCDAGGQRLLSRITRRSAHNLEIEPGKAVYAQVKSVALMK